MSKLTESIGTFVTGDLVFTRYPPKGSQPIHVTLFLAAPDGAGTPANGPGYVHAGATHVEISGIATYADDRDSGGYLHAHSADPHRRARIAAVAKGFAPTAGNPVVSTPYGSFPSSKDFEAMGVVVKSPRASRFNGMIGTQNVTEIPFGFPALHRLLKWTLRSIRVEPLSRNRGITCAAFVSACNQIAEMKNFLQSTVWVSDQKLEECVRTLDGLVEKKTDLRKGLELIATTDAGKNIYREQARAEHSNRKLTNTGKARLGGMFNKVARDDLSDEFRDRVPSVQKVQGAMQLVGVANQVSTLELMWLSIQTNLLGIHESQAELLSTILPAEFYFDAKYVSSMALAAAMQGAAAWNTTIYDKYA